MKSSMYPLHLNNLLSNGAIAYVIEFMECECQHSCVYESSECEWKYACVSIFVTERRKEGDRQGGYLSNAEISQTTGISCHTLGIFRKLSMNEYGGVHWLGLKLFGAMVEKLLIPEPFSQWKLNKIETENCIQIWGCSWCCWKALGKSDCVEFISQVLELRCGRYWYFSGFCCWKFKQIAKIGFGKKNQLSPLNVFTLLNF
jgi:hypothetical protein